MAPKNSFNILALQSLAPYRAPEKTNMSQYGSQHFFKRPKIPKHAILNMLFGLSLAICLGHQASQEIPNKKATKAPQEGPKYFQEAIEKSHLWFLCLLESGPKVAPKLA
jgi:hypothetical protein